MIVRIRRTTPRFGAHFDELLPCAVERTDGAILILRESECFQRIEAIVRPKPKLRIDCVHRGADAIRLEQCSTCSGTVMLKVFPCAVHGECCIGKSAAGVKSCGKCGEYLSVETAISQCRSS